MKRTVSLLLCTLLAFALLTACGGDTATDGTVTVKGERGGKLTYQLVEIGSTDDGRTCLYVQGSEGKKNDTFVCASVFSGGGFEWEVYIGAAITCGETEYAPVETIPYLSSRPGNVVCFVFDTKDAPDTVTIFDADHRAGAATLTVSELTLDPALSVSNSIVEFVD